MVQGFGVWSKSTNPSSTGLTGWLPHGVRVRSLEQKSEPFRQHNPGRPKVRTLLPKQRQGSQESEPFHQDRLRDASRSSPCAKTNPGRPKVRTISQQQPWGCQTHEPFRQSSPGQIKSKVITIWKGGSPRGQPLSHNYLEGGSPRGQPLSHNYMEGSSLRGPALQS